MSTKNFASIVRSTTNLHGVGPQKPFLHKEAVRIYADEILSDPQDLFIDAAGLKPEDKDWVFAQVDVATLPPSARGAMSPQGERGRGEVTRPTFMVGHDAYVQAANMVRGVSPLSEHIDGDLLRKVGDQGNRFHVNHLMARVYPEYFRGNPNPTNPWIKDWLEGRDGTLMVHAYVVAKDFVKRVGAIQPLTREEAIEVTCSKDTASWPNGGSKASSETRAFLLEHFDDPDWKCSVLAGQRYQRNKHCDDGTPLPRGVFNCDVVTVARCNRWLVPILRALQRNAEIDHQSPYCELNGPKAVGLALAEYTSASGTHEDFSSILADVKGMDKCSTEEHMGFFAEEAVWPCYDPTRTDRALLEQIKRDLLAPFSARLYVPGVGVINPKGLLFWNLLSGIVNTHLPESFWSLVYNRATIATVMLKTADAPLRTLRARGGTLMLVAGDDSGVVTKIPRQYVKAALSAVYDGEGKPYGYGIVDHMVKIMAYFGFEARHDKQDVLIGALNFCSHTYSSRAWETKMDDAGHNRVLAFKPVYSPVLAVNGLLNPEDGVASKLLSTEVQRMAMILDSTVGHESYDKLYNTVLNSLGEQARKAIKDYLSDGLDTIEVDEHLIQSWVTYDIDWEPASSPTLSRMSADLGNSVTPMTDLARRAARDARILRTTFWMYRMTPESVLDARFPATDGEAAWDTEKRFSAFFEDDIEFLQYALVHNPAGEPGSLRDPRYYNHSKSFLENFPLDQPLQVAQASASSASDLALAFPDDEL